MQGSKLYVGNLNYSVTAEQLEELFASYGEVMHVNIIEGTDERTREPLKDSQDK